MAIVLALFGFACIAYGASVMMLHSGTSFFVVWYVLGVLLVASGLATHLHAWEALPTLAKRVGLGFGAFAIAVLLLTQGLVVSQLNARGEEGLDYIVVLGAQVRPDGSPSAVLQYRLDAAYDYLVANPHTCCIVTGGRGPNEPMPEAQCMARYLKIRGIDPGRILEEDRACNTQQNIAYSKAFLDPASDAVGIVTNNFHVYRGVGLARKAGYRHVCGIAAYSTPYYQPNNMLRESLGIIKDFLAGNL